MKESMQCYTSIYDNDESREWKISNFEGEKFNSHTFFFVFSHYFLFISCMKRKLAKPTDSMGWKVMHVQKMLIITRKGNVNTHKGPPTFGELLTCSCELIATL